MNNRKIFKGILLNKVGLTGELESCYDKIVCSKGVLDLDDIYLERTKGYEKGDSGWFVGSLDENDKEEELEAFSRLSLYIMQYSKYNLEVGA